MATWVTPKGKIINRPEDQHIEVLERQGVDSLEAYNLGWVRLRGTAIEGTAESIEKHKDTILDWIGDSSFITIDFLTPRGYVVVQTSSWEMQETSVNQLLRSAIIRMKAEQEISLAGPHFRRPVRVHGHRRRA